MVFLSRHCFGKGPHLALRGESRDFSRVRAVGLGFLSSCDGDLRIPLKWKQGNQDSSQVEVGNLCFLSSCSRNTEFLSSCCWKLGVSSRVAAGDSELLSICSRKSVFLWSSSVGCKIPLESWWETRGSSRVWLVLRVPGDLCWGLLSSSLGATCF